MKKIIKYNFIVCLLLFLAISSIYTLLSTHTSAFAQNFVDRRLFFSNNQTKILSIIPDKKDKSITITANNPLSIAFKLIENIVYVEIKNAEFSNDVKKRNYNWNFYLTSAIKKLKRATVLEQNDNNKIIMKLEFQKKLSVSLEKPTSSVAKILFSKYIKKSKDYSPPCEIDKKEHIPSLKSNEPVKKKPN